MSSSFVLNGLDRLTAMDFASLRGQRVGLITNHTGISRSREHILDLMLKSGVNLVALFGPEHGIRGDHDETFRVASSVDEETGLPIHSLFSTIQRPTAEMLQGIDTLVFDIADVGVRYYTYTTTMTWCMEEAVKQNIRFVVLDRPNPMTGIRVEGPVLNPAFQGLSSYHQIPTLHGLTAGELAQFSNHEYDINCELEIVQCEGWRREMWFDETALPWVNPSPNLRNFNQLMLYTVIAGFEASQVAVGRGTDSPFEHFGAPYMQELELAQALNEISEDLHLRFVPEQFIPHLLIFENQLCAGCFVYCNDREKLHPVEANIYIAAKLVELYKDQLSIRRSAHLLGGPAIAEALDEGVTADEIIASWQDDLAKYLNIRENYLIYT